MYYFYQHEKDIPKFRSSGSLIFLNRNQQDPSKNKVEVSNKVLTLLQRIWESNVNS